jgi:hypothetical protein
MIHRGVVEMTTVGQSRGKPCVTETCRDSRALMAPSARQTKTTARVARSDGDPRSGAIVSVRLLLSGVLLHVAIPRDDSL